MSAPVPSAATDRPLSDVRELRGQVRAWRRGHADTRLVDALGDAYIAVFATLMLGSIAVNVVLRIRDEAGAACLSAACSDARTSLPWVFALGLLTGCLALARLFGPMLVSPAVGSWLLTAPVDRGALLRPRLAATGLVAFGVGGLLTAAGAAMAGFEGGAVASFAVTVGAACLAAVGFACLAQAASSAAARWASWLLAALTWGGVLLLTLGAVPVSRTETRFGGAWWVALGVTGVVAVLLVARAIAALHRMHRDQLTPGGSLVPGLSGALASLDLTLVYDILLARHWLSRSTVRPVRGRGVGVTALVWRDVVRLRRAPQSVVVLAAALVLPYLAVSVGLGRLVLLVAAGTGFVASLGLFSALRVTSRTASLVRCLPLEPWAVKAGCTAVPGALLLVWALAAAPAERTALQVSWPVALLIAVAVGAAALSSVTRWMTGRPPDYQLPLVTSPMGAVPTSLYVSAARGLDVLLLVTAPLLFSPTVLGAEIAIGLGAVVMSILLSRR